MITLIFFFFNSLSFSQEPTCQQSYTRFYDKPEINISIFLGYNDVDDLTLDIGQRARMVEIFEKPCSNGEFACGFKRDPKDARLLTKVITGPDKNPRTIQLKIMNPSVSNDHTKNRTSSDQKQKSQEIEREFLKSLSADDAVFYVGHSAVGTGPSFNPKDKKDWAKAISTKESLKKMTETLRSAKTKPKLIGYLSCDSESNYGQVLHSSSPSSALILTKQETSFFDIERTTISSLDSLLGMKCKSDFQQSLSQATHHFNIFKYGKQKTFAQAIPDVRGFFEPIQENFPTPNSPATQWLGSKFLTRVPYHPGVRTDSDYIPQGTK